MSDKPVCDVCGEPAHHGSRDLIETVPLTKDTWREYEHYGEPRYGCKKHPPRLSHTYYIGNRDYPMETIKNE